MYLHEAMEQVLQEHKEPMTSREIADVINAAHLYMRGDGEPVPASQISARLSHHLDKFERVGSKIKLVH